MGEAPGRTELAEDSVHALHGGLGLLATETAFPWQVELLRKFMAGHVPGALDVPTGLGKTAVMAIWLVARAAGASVPRRLVYVVDRRAVVDQATTEAERLRGWVARSQGVQKALGLESPLPISTLRGQHVDNRQWLVDPSAPAILVGTVDMVGSRLLFEGYGVSRKMRPYHAGLLGLDTLIVLDEAHLSPPFERLIERVASGRDCTGRSLVPEAPSLQALLPPLRCISLSATGRQRDADVHRLGPLDRAHPVVQRRLSAQKKLVIQPKVTEKDLPEALAREAIRLSHRESGQPQRIMVFCNSRDHAQRVMEALQAMAPSSDAIDTELFVGGRRVFEREVAACWLAERGFLAGTEGQPERPSFVIATSAGEVGVDLDADHAVFDLVAWERMVQRLGRVNRRGKGDADVVVVPTLRETKAEEAVQRYRTWRAWQNARAQGDATPEDDEADGSDGGKAIKLKEEDRRLAEQTLRREACLELLGHLPALGAGMDASPDGILQLQARVAEDTTLGSLLERARTPDTLHPPLTRALVEAWSMTSLREHTGRPEVDPWIRGWPEENDETQTTVVWRRHLPLDLGGEMLRGRDLEAFRDCADPHLVEKLETETHRVVRWLLERQKALVTESSSADKAGLPEPALRRSDIVAVILKDRLGEVRGLTLEELSKKASWEYALPGAILLVDLRLGGLKNGLLSAEPTEPVLDITEFEPSTAEQTRLVPFRVRRLESPDEDPSEEWRVEVAIPLRDAEGEPGAWIVIESLVRQPAQSEEGRSGARRAQLLEEHGAWTEAAAARLATRLNLPEPYAELLSVAARLHDEGKRAPRWQRAFHAPSGEPYAKTLGRPDLSLLEGYRHELGSLPHAEVHARVRALPDDLRELCLHMIAAHHGFARPILSTDGATEPPSRLVLRAQQVALRFATLELRWGPWGLAWWETLLRAADQQASRRNDLAGGTRG